MHLIETMAFLAALLLFFVVALFILRELSKVLAQKGMPLEARRAWEDRLLIGLVFLSTLALLAWRMVC
jgi:hypothetical protein